MSQLVFEQNLTDLTSNKDYFYLLDANVEINLSSDKVIAVKVTEKIKSLEQYKVIIEKLLALGINRRSHLVVIGGGCLSDLGGHIAATLFRGISWSVVPTTLLSQVDASIGGKTALNFKMIKNIIGSFHLPRDIYINSDFLKTLKEEDILSGKGEIIKYGFLDKDIFLSIINKKSLTEIIKKCALYKYKITSEDPKENSKRIILNLGHTIGHGIESATGYPHGVCVALGLEMIIKIFSPNLKPKLDSMLEHLKVDLTKYSLPDKEVIKKFLIYDKKKIIGNVIQVIIPNDIAQIEVKKIDLNELFLKIDLI